MEIRTKLEPRTIRRRKTSLQKYALWATGVDNLLKDFRTPKPARPVPHPVPGGIEGLQRMMDQARNCEQEALIGLCGFAGLRISEARGIKLTNFDLTDMWLTVRGKGDQTRIIPLSNRVWKACQEAYIVARSEGRNNLITYSSRGARQAITKMGERAGIEKPVSSHDLRMTFGSEAFDRCGNLRTVQELLGHSSPLITASYTAIRWQNMREAVIFDEEE